MLRQAVGQGPRTQDLGNPVFICEHQEGAADTTWRAKRDGHELREVNLESRTQSVGPEKAKPKPQQPELASRPAAVRQESVPVMNMKRLVVPLSVLVIGVVVIAYILWPSSSWEFQVGNGTSHPGNPNPKLTWTTRATFTSQTECEREKERHLNARDVPGSTRTPHGYSVPVLNNQVVTVEWACRKAGG